MFLQIISDAYSFLDYVSAFAVIAFIIVFFLSIKEFLKDFEENYSKLKTRISKPTINENLNEVLNAFFPYYKSLKPELQHKFASRVEVFLDMKTFIPRQCEVNEKLNILIAASAVQLTFGLKKFTLFSFKKILIYPDSYYNEIRKQYHKGEVNTEFRLVILSANHFLDGIKNPEDGINLGLHEMAHALNYDAYVNKDTLFLKAFKLWETVARKEMLNIKNNSNHFLRNYAANNLQEMFAVSTEYFFEKPEAFQQKLPALYNAMLKVFRQNPAVKHNPLPI